MKIIHLNHFNDIDMNDENIHDYTIYIKKPLTYNSNIALVYFDDDEGTIEIDGFIYVLEISIIVTDFIPYWDLNDKSPKNQEQIFKEIFYYGLMDAYLPDEMHIWSVEKVIKTCVEFDHIKDYNIRAIENIDWSIGAHLRWYSFENNRLQISLDKSENSYPILELKEMIEENKKLVLFHGYKSMELLYHLVIFNLGNNRAYNHEEIAELLKHIINDNQY
jgi:hypothetical protein